MEAIRIWFNTGKNYNAGVKLYLQYGRDEKLKRLFSTEGISDFKQQKLEQVLQAMISVSTVVKLHPETSATVIQPLVQKKIAVAPEKAWGKYMDAVERSLYEQSHPLFLEMVDLQSRLDVIARLGNKDPNKKEEAGRMALRILDLDEQCEAIYAKRDYYLQHGQLPEEPKPMDICLDPNLWPKKLANHERYVREFKIKLQKEPSNTKQASLLQKHEWAVAEYKKLLKLD